LETSAGAGIGAALLRVANTLGVERLGAREHQLLNQAGRTAVLSVAAYLEDGYLSRVSAGTVIQLIPFGYTVIRDDRPQPWGQGMMMDAFAAWRTTQG
jgi:unsaturated rhamnogalacturonyl hydrolase